MIDIDFRPENAGAIGFDFPSDGTLNLKFEFEFLISWFFCKEYFDYRRKFKGGGERIIGLLGQICRFDEVFAQALLDRPRIHDLERHLNHTGQLETFRGALLAKRFNLDVVEQRVEALQSIIHNCLTRNNHERTRVMFDPQTAHLTGEAFQEYLKFAHEAALRKYE